MAIKKILLLALILAAASSYAQDAEAGPPPAAESPAYRVEAAGKSFRFFQRLSWEPEDYALRYEVIIEQESGGEFTQVIRESTEDAFIEVSIPHGNYRYRVLAYNILDQAGEGSDWQYFEVLEALIPVINAFTPGYFYLDEDTPRSITLQGRHFQDSAILLKPRRSGDVLTPSKVEIDAGGERALLFFDEADLLRNLFRLNRYDIYVENSGGLWASTGPFKVALSKPYDLLVSLGYAPMFYLSADILEKKFQPIGLDARVAFVPFKWKFGYVGAELAPFWNMITAEESGHLAGAHINGLYQKYLNRTMAINVRLGGGITSVLDLKSSGTESLNTWFFSMGAGASFQWFIYRGFFVEAGADYMHLFSQALPTGILMPWVNAGWRF
jgi:hypothetical protein